MSVSLKESISGNQRVESADRPNNATSVNNGVFHRERLRFRGKLIGEGEGRTELVCRKYSFKLRENTIIKSSSVNNSIRCVFERLGCLVSGTQNRGSVDFIKTESIYVLELIATKDAILTCMRLSPLVKSIHVQVDNVVALSYLTKLGGHRTKFCLD